MRVLALQKTKRTIGLIGLLIIGWLLAGGTAVFASTPLEAGFFDFTYPSGTGGNGSTTAEKPESKLWHHDGFWWGVMWSTSTNAYTIHKLDWATQNWSNTGVQVDDRKASLADALSDGNTLYIVSHVWTTSGATAGAGDRGKLYRYSYSGGGYTLDSGYPIEINEAKTEALTITKDSTGMLWSTWVENAQVMVAHSNASGGGDSDWTTPYLLPVTGNDVKSDDLSSMVAFDGYVGVMWSRQKSGIDMHFAAHKDGTADDVWTSTIPYSTSGDDHMNLKSLQADDAGDSLPSSKPHSTPSSFNYWYVTPVPPPAPTPTTGQQPRCGTAPTCQPVPSCSLTPATAKSTSLPASAPAMSAWATTFFTKRPPSTTLNLTLPS